MKNEQSLQNRLRMYGQSDALPMHMPGHKRNLSIAPFLKGLDARMDITEIEGFDDLHHPEGILKESMELAAALWKSERSFFLVNGSTCGILAGMRAVLCPGDEVILARNSHRSVYHALELCGAKPWFLLPQWNDAFGICGSISPQAVECALREHPRAKLVVITSPTYEGVLSDLGAIAQIVHRHGAILLVDEAHGAHLGLFGVFPSGAVAAGADLVIQSVHKTLLCLTQTALLHCNGSRVSPQQVARQLSIFETSSPSYLLMGAMDGLVRELWTDGEALLRGWRQALAMFMAEASGLLRMKILGMEGEMQAIYALDPSKILICTRGCNLTGPQLMRRLREEYGIELEMSAPGYALAMTGAGDTCSTLKRFAQALHALDATVQEVPQAQAVDALPLALPRLAMQPCDAVHRRHQRVPVRESVGRISAEYVWAYPPGIPLLIPGEEISQEFLRAAAAMQQAGIVLRTSYGEWQEGVDIVL